ncbi:putative two-component response-regulatory protein YehT [Planococcus massiliensis]|uniref:Putative two-component response-regulatory protein YehT n=1 Tax=Planococcus massiliensis TaxID=1499687 RepID=A0A098EIS8_9BACL|nr:LytTR family DNA-binding domain-containing protein [Planococcus massiliensis]CEG22183.1 putative two-component response-regulatory protein YehT [Planococcus massiliensis]
MEKLALKQMGFIMGDWIPEEASIAVAVDGRYVYYKSGKRELKICIGDEVLPGSVADRTYTERKRIEMLVEESVLGAAYFGIGYPVQAAGKSGVLVIILPPDYMIRQKQPVRFLTGKVDEAWKPIPVEQISHIESSQKKTWFYADEEAYCSIHTLKYLKDRLPDWFLPIHRSYIVNISYIMEISRDFSSNYLLTMKDGSVLPVSQNYTSSVRERLGF